MAIFDPGRPDILSGYASVQRALEQRAELAGKDTGGWGAANAVVAPVVNEIDTQRKQKREEALLYFKADLEDRVNQSQFERQIKKEGRKIITAEDITDLETDQGLEPGTLKILEGRMMTADELTDALTKTTESMYTKYFAEEMQKGEKANQAKLKSAAVRASGKEGAKEYLKNEMIKDTPFGQMTPVKSNTSSTGWEWVQRDRAGNITSTGLEAPDPSKSKGGVSLDKRKREEALRNKFDNRVKEIGFEQKKDALTSAINAIENPSPTNDHLLIYGLAKSADGGGRLSDKDVEQAGSGGNLPGDLQKYWNYTVSKENLLPASVREKMVSSILQTYSAKEKELKKIEKDYLRLAESEAEGGVDPKNVVLNRRPSTDTAKAIQYLMDNQKKVNMKNIKAVIQSGILTKGNSDEE